MRANEQEKKKQALQEHSCWNSRWASVKEPLFSTNDFFNAEDLVQVKYELLRQVREENVNVTAACKSFGFSRVRYYQILRDFEADGISGLFPRVKGPRRSHKLTDRVLEFIDQQMKGRRTLTSHTLAQILEEQLGVNIHPRSIERALTRRKKKRSLLKPSVSLDGIQNNYELLRDISINRGYSSAGSSWGLQLFLSQGSGAWFKALATMGYLT